jgi:hypothetical protein
VLRLQTTTPVELLTNGSFESALSGWTIANPTADKVKCDPALPTKFAHSGVCGLKLTGTAGAITKIRQPLTVLVGDAGDTVSLAVWAKGRALNAIVQVKAVLNTSAGQQLVKRKLPPGTYGFSHQSNSAVIGGTLLSGSLQIIVRSGSGKVFVDDVSLQVFESTANPLLPLPAPADNF